MRIVPFLVVAVGCTARPPASSPAPPSPGPEPLTLDQALSTPSLLGLSPSRPKWAPDSRHLAFLWNEAGAAVPQLYVVAPDGSGRRRVGPKTAVSDYAWTPDGRSLLSLREDELWSTAVDPGGPNVVVAKVGAGARDLSVSPDGTRAAYLRDGDLWLLDLDDGTTHPATELGLPPLSPRSNGRYSRREREIGPGIWGGPTYAWSPDGRFIAVHAVDRRDLRKVPFPDYLGPETKPNPVRRGYPGDANEARTVGLLRVADRSLRWLELEAPADNQIVDFAWSPDNLLLVDRASDTAVDRRLYAVEPLEGAVREIWRSHRPSRIYTAFASAWHPDGRRVVFLSDRGDRYGLYVIDPDAAEAEPILLTDPGYDVIGPPLVVARTGQIFYAANAPTPHEQHIFRVGTDGSKPLRLTHLPGTHHGLPSPDGRHLALLHSDDVSPTELYVVSTDGGEAKRVTTSPRPEFLRRRWARGRYVDVPSRIDDNLLHVRILEPSPIDPERTYPVILGPVYSNSARNRWSGRYSLVQQLMVQRGYIVVQVDVRGSTGYGRGFREAFLTDFAGGDLEDLASAVGYLKTLPHVDPSRIGIWGSSYGGTLTIYSLLTKPGLFRAGVAAAAAVDPFFFGPDDVAIVRRPATHPEIFERAAKKYAGQLEDHLLLIHGMRDQVVPFKTAVVLADALIRAGKDFDFAIAPGATHAWSREAPYSSFLFKKLMAHFDRHLGPEALRPHDEAGAPPKL